MDFLPLLLTGFLAIDCSIIRQYHYVDVPLTWDNAKTYCQSNYSDLASVRSDEEWKVFGQAAGVPPRIGWIGLHHVRYNWSWTMEDKHLYNYEDGTFAKWTDPSPGVLRQCASLEGGKWIHLYCSNELRFVCQNAEFKYFLIERMMEWTRALEYCRRNYTDLANIRSDADKSALASLAGDQTVWIGLHNRWRWADGGLLTLHMHKLEGNLQEKDMNKCVFVNESLYAVYENCTYPKPFYCHKDELKRLTVKITIRSPYNFEENPALHELVLHQIHHELSKQNPEQNVTVTWKKQNYHVFQKKREERAVEDKQP